MAISFVTLAMFLAGWALAERLGCLDARARGLEADDSPPCERIAAAAVLGLALWLGVNWVLSPFHAVARWPLLGCAGIAAVAGALGMRHRARGSGDGPALARRWQVLAGVTIVPLLAWLAFVLWRAWLIPPEDFDALAYHLPKAVMLARNGGYGYLWFPDFRSTAYPPNFELLLADVMVLQGSDRLTAWVSTLMFVLFLVTTAALLQRWWGRGLHVLAGVLLVASSPVVLLGSGVQKNDIMANVFFLAAFLWAGRWYVGGGSVPALLVVISVALALGTKGHGVLLVAGLVPVAVAGVVRHWRLGRRVPVRVAVAAMALAGGLFLALGGVTYLVNLQRTGSPLGIPPDSHTGAGYGDWDNLWMFPYLLFAAPLSLHPGTVWVPWQAKSWVWPTYERYLSTFALPFSLLVLLVPVGVWWYRRRAPLGGREIERIVTSLAILATFVAMLPIRLRPTGMFVFFPRFFVFLTPAIAGWTLVPLMRDLMSTRARLAAALLVACSTIFVTYGVGSATQDKTMPMPFVREQVYDGASRRRAAGVRSTTVVDEFAEPQDHIVMEGSLDSWVYPLFGRDLTRKVTFLRPGSTIADIPADARWVVVDRPYNICWGHPDFTDWSLYSRYMMKGSPSEDDVRLLHELKAHPEQFVLVYENPGMNQAVFATLPTSARPPLPQAASN